LLIPLAQLALQNRIVAKIEVLFAQADIIEQAVSLFYAALSTWISPFWHGRFEVR